jgi:hypothetical protein
MALYDYELTIVGDGGGDRLSTQLVDADLLWLADAPGEAAVLAVTAYVSEGDAYLGSSELAFITLQFDNEPFEALVHSRFDDFLDWWWRTAQAVEPLTMFIPSGSDARRSLPDANNPLGDLPELITSGRPTVAHPVVYYSEQLAGGVLCAPRQTVAFYRVERRLGLGCLYMFVNRSGNQAEILESGALQHEMIAQLTPRE